MEEFLISTTITVAGLFAVLAWTQRYRIVATASFWPPCR